MTMHDLFPTLSVNEPTATKRKRARVKSETRATYGLPTIGLFTSDELALLEQARAMLDSKLSRGASLTDPDAAGNFCMMKLAGLEREEFLVVFLDTQHKVIAAEALFAGTVDGCEVHPREVVKRALHHNAAAVILAHNHPSSGSTEPSAADRAVTARLREALWLVDVRILDHFIVSGGRYQSMAAMGML